MSLANKTVQTYIILLVITSVVLTVMMLKVRSMNEELLEQVEVVSSEAAQDTVQSVVIDHSLLGTLDDVVAKTYNFLIKKPYGDEYNVKELSKILYRELCKGERCQINLFDDRRAYEIYARRIVHMKEDWGEDYGSSAYLQAMKKWDKNNYPFIANHLVCSHFFGGDIVYFPYKDDYYLKLVQSGVKSTKKDTLLEENSEIQVDQPSSIETNPEEKPKTEM